MMNTTGLIIILAALLAGYLASTAANLYRKVKQARERQRCIDLMRATWNNRPRAKIVRIGVAGHLEDGSIFIEDFLVEQSPGIPEVMNDPFTGQPVFHGYTIDELAEISQRRAEWNLDQ